MRTRTIKQQVLAVRAAAAFVIVLFACQVALVTSDDGEPHPNRGESLPKLMSFDEFQGKFDKHYKSLVELMVRRTLFIPRAIRAAISAVRFHCRLSAYRLGLNHLSDFTPEERQRMVNKRLKVNDSASLAGGGGLDGVTRVRIDSTNFEQYLRELASEEEEAHHERHKRSIERAEEDGEEQEEGEEEDHNEENTEEKEEKTTDWKLETVDYYDFEEAERSNAREAKRANKSQVGKPDKVKFDLRDHSDCFFEPRNQGLCGSCYAFAITSLLEWHYCQRTGQKLDLSEQYIIDCGRNHGELMPNGCGGGTFEQAAMFVHNFGAEKRNAYPYEGAEGECPYNPTLHPLKMLGHLRIRIHSTLSLPVAYWNRVLKYGPLWVTVRAGDSFVDYERGVHTEAEVECQDEAKVEPHAMLLVGHGREGGHEYWLFRNSYSSDWGERGYYKLPKSAAAKCVQLNEGMKLGTTNGRDYSFRITTNRHNKDGAVLRDHAIARETARELKKQRKEKRKRKKQLRKKVTDAE